MTILEDENIILNDDSFIINSIKEWFANSICDIIISKNDPGRRMLGSLCKELNNSPGVEFLSSDEYNKEKMKYLLKMDDKDFLNFVSINKKTSPVAITVHGSLIVQPHARNIPINLFTIEKINGWLDLSQCELETTDGYPDRKNISGGVYLDDSSIKNNKYL